MLEEDDESTVPGRRGGRSAPHVEVHGVAQRDVKVFALVDDAVKVSIRRRRGRKLCRQHVLLQRCTRHLRVPAEARRGVLQRRTVAGDRREHHLPVRPQRRRGAAQRPAALLHRRHHDLLVRPQLLGRKGQQGAVLLHRSEHDLPVIPDVVRGCGDGQGVLRHEGQHELAVAALPGLAAQGPALLRHGQRGLVCSSRASVNVASHRSWGCAEVQEGHLS
mmetsp:Transcript_76422/g.224219  ORF Transcript_76422/g.224219 Transcript_76422/m.224219 type:complete len:219 (+) Transcript_76422:39-695(+)